MGQDRPLKLSVGMKINEKTGTASIPMVSVDEISFEAIEQMYGLIREPLEIRRKKGLAECEPEIKEIGEKP